MSDLTALQRRRYAAVAAIFSSQYKDAEARQELTLEFRSRLASSLEKEHGLKKSTLLAFIEYESKAPASLQLAPPMAERQAKLRKIRESQQEILPAVSAVIDEADKKLVQIAAELEKEPMYRAQELLDAAM